MKHITISLSDELYDRLVIVAKAAGTPDEFDSIAESGIESEVSDLEAYHGIPIADQEVTCE